MYLSVSMYIFAPMITILLSLLLSHNVTTTTIGVKNFFLFEVTTDVPITQQYAANYSVTLNTGATLYYYIVFEPNPNTTFFQAVRFPAGVPASATVVSYTMSGWGPVNTETTHYNGIQSNHSERQRLQ